MPTQTPFNSPFYIPPQAGGGEYVPNSIDDPEYAKKQAENKARIEAEAREKQAEGEQQFKEQFKAPVIGSYIPYGGAVGSSETFGREAGAAAANSARLGQAGWDSDNRGAAQINNAKGSALDWSGRTTKEAIQRDLGGAMRLARDAAEGKAPSAAQIQQQRGVEDSMRAQATMAASAGGSPLAQAAAAQNAQMQAGQMAQNAVGEAAQLRAQEMAAARQQYAGAADAMVNQYRELRDQEIGMESINAQLRQGQDAINDRRALGFQGLKQQGDVAQAQLNIEALKLEMARQGYTADQIAKYVGAGVGLLSGGIGAAMQAFPGSQSAPAKPPGPGSDIRMKENIQPIGYDDPMGQDAGPMQPMRGARQMQQAPVDPFSFATGSNNAPNAKPSEMEQFANKANELKTGKSPLTDQQKFGQALMMGGLNQMQSSLMQPTGFDPNRYGFKSDIRAKENIEPVSTWMLPPDETQQSVHWRPNLIEEAHSKSLDGRQYRRDIEDSPAAASLANRVEKIRASQPQNMSKPAQNMNPVKALNETLANNAMLFNYKDPNNSPTTVPKKGPFAGTNANELEKIPVIGKQLVSKDPNSGMNYIERDAMQSAQLAGQGLQQQEINALNQKVSALAAANQAFAKQNPVSAMNSAFPGEMDPDELAASGKLNPRETALLKSMMARGR